MSLTNTHAEWLSLVDISGPFLAIPVLTHTFPQGLEELSSFKRRRLRQAYDEWREALELEDPQLEDLHSAWIDEVLSRVLEFDDDGKGDVLKREEWCRSHLKSVLPDQGVVEYPDLAVVDEQQDNKPLLLIHTYKPNVELESTVKHEGWITTPADRMVQLCRSLGCRLGLLTNGECWMLVDAPVGAVTSFSSWYARLWSQEPITLQAFVHLLGIRRFFVDESEQLPALFDASLKYQDEVTDALGEQVCRAVEVLIQSLDKADQDRNRELLHDVNETELYEAALAVMMRLVFLLSAEEQGLLLLGDECYESNYAISTLRMQLRQEPSELLERRWDAWTRLLSTFRAVYGGVEHENLRLPALGSSLFDPDHFPFLEGRAKGSNWKIDTAVPLPINNRTVLLLLESIQLFQGRTLSYRALDVEQIGYVYEGLLERTVKRAAEVTLELNATKKAQSPWITLAELDSVSMDGTEQLIELLHERSGSSISKIRNDLSKLTDDSLIERLLITCQGDTKLRDRIKPYVHLLRTDPWGYPLVYPAGSFIVTSGSNRRETGTHYTPKSLTEAIVAETLTPLTYIGPTEGIPREQWQLKSSSELLDLKICDPAMGSGAFLVQTCRWLADRLVESWAKAEESGKKISIDGDVLVFSETKELLPRDIDNRIIIARNLIAERCLYGVDLNPLAVELAKLSIWLVTLSKGRPFGFLEHSLRCGDSLLGIHDLDQLIQLSMSSNIRGKYHHFGENVQQAVNEATEMRKQLREITIQDISDINYMENLYKDVQCKLEVAIFLADSFIAETFVSSGNLSNLEVSLSVFPIQAKKIIEGDETQLHLMRKRTEIALTTNFTSHKLTHRPIHWPLEFPEVFNRHNGGFDAIVGNPPFLGGQRITGIMGTAYRDWLVQNLADGRRGSADLAAYFFLRSWNLLRQNCNFGLVAVNTIAEGDTRQVGLEAMVQTGAVIYSAYPNEPWPGKASVVTSRVHIHKGEWLGERKLLGQPTKYISAFLSCNEEISPSRLKASKNAAFIGTYLLGLGFVLSKDEALSMLMADSKNAEVIFPYLDGDDLKTIPEQRPTRWVINFWDWPEEKAKGYSLPYAWIEKNVKEERLSKKDRGAREKWWLPLRARPELYHAIGRGQHFHNHPASWSKESCTPEYVLVAGRVGKYFNPSVVKNDVIFHEKCVVFALHEVYAYAALFNSSPIDAWVWKHSSRMKLDLNFSPSDAVETLPLVMGKAEISLLDKLGRKYLQTRSELMNNGNKPIGLTRLYNRFHNQSDCDPHIELFRKLQRELDRGVMYVYGWDDIDLSHDYYEQPHLAKNDRIRYTISDNARTEILRRLTVLNRKRFDEEN